MSKPNKCGFFSQFVKLFCFVAVALMIVILVRNSGDFATDDTSANTTVAPTSSATSTEEKTTQTTQTTATTVTQTTVTSSETTQSTTETTETTRESGYITKIPTDSEMKALISDKLLTINKYSRPSTKYLDEGVTRKKITHVVVHYVANSGSSAINNRNYFENLRNREKTYAGAHYIVGLDGEIIRCIPDDEIAYHAGNADMNACSIGIEVCHPDNTGRFNYKTYLSLLKLVSWLCDKYDIPVSNVIRHYDVTGKACPIYYVQYGSEWKKFKERLIFN